MKEGIKLFNISNAKQIKKNTCDDYFFYYKQCKIVYSFFCFSILINTKCYYPLYESMWEKRSDLETLNFTWEKIDISRIKQLYEICFAKSNFKLLHCIVNSNLAVSKWNENVSPLCDVC